MGKKVFFPRCLFSFFFVPKNYETFVRRVLGTFKLLSLYQELELEKVFVSKMGPWLLAKSHWAKQHLAENLGCSPQGISWIGSNTSCPCNNMGSLTSNGREPKSCLDRVFNFKLESFDSYRHKCIVFMQAILELNSRPRGLYHKTFYGSNKFHSKFVSLLLVVSFTGLDKHTNLLHYRINYVCKKVLR